MRANDASDAKLVTADWLAGEIDKPDIVVVEEDRTRDVAGEEFAMRVAMLGWQVPGPIDDHEIRLVDLAGKPVRRHQLGVARIVRTHGVLLWRDPLAIAPWPFDW